MIIIDHRRNSIDLLNSTSTNYGVEIDLRNHGSELIVTHDPFCSEGIIFSEWLKHFKHKLLIINVKEEGLEDKILPLLKKFKISSFFFLDESFPYIRKWALSGVPNFALRVSEFEDKKTALNLSAWLIQHGKSIDWIWVDTFMGDLLDIDILFALKEANFKLCFVSPELHYAADPDSWSMRANRLIQSMKDKKFIPDAVCSKLPIFWQEKFYEH